MGFSGSPSLPFFYARNTKVSWPGIGDGLVIVSSLGVFFGRIANFINGELYGRVTSAGIGMKFPKELLEPENEGNLRAAMAEAKGADPERLGQLWQAYDQAPNELRGQMFEEVMTVSRDNPAVLEVLAKYVETRHPSQLYQALLEGLGLCLILFMMRIRWPRMPHGVITGTFFILYATFRIVAEQFPPTGLDVGGGKYGHQGSVLLGLHVCDWRIVPRLRLSGGRLAAWVRMAARRTCLDADLANGGEGSFESGSQPKCREHAKLLPGQAREDLAGDPGEPSGMGDRQEN